MTILFMGGEMASFMPSDGAAFEFHSNTLFHDPNFSRACIECIGSLTSFYVTEDITIPDAFYTHFYLRRNTIGDYPGTVISFSTATTEVFRVIHTTGVVLQMQAFISGVWTNVGASVTYSQEDLVHVDVYISGNSASGTAKLFLAGTERVSATADLSAVVGLKNARFYGQNSMVSQVIIADEPTIGWRLLTRYPSGAGGSSAWTGAYTDIDEITYDDADFILSGTANQISTFTQTGPSITGYVVRAVGVFARAKCGASGPQKIRPVLRVSGVDYPSGSDITLSVGYKAVGAIWETNPATSAAWVNTAVDTIQPGVKSIA